MCLGGGPGVAPSARGQIRMNRPWQLQNKYFPLALLATSMVRSGYGEALCNMPLRYPVEGGKGADGEDDNGAAIGAGEEGGFGPH